MHLKRLCAKTLLAFILTTSLHSYDESQLTSLYSGLDPDSITEHLALYKLYPNKEIGQKALEHAQSLLKKNQDEEALKKLPAALESIDGFVQLMLGKEQKREVLEKHQLSAIEAISKHLLNRHLKGHQAQSEEDILSLQPEEIDLSRAILLAQHEGDKIDWDWIRTYEAQLDFLALQVIARLKENPTPKEIISKINQVLFFDLKYRFPNQYIQDEHEKFSQLTAVLDLKQGVCLGTTIVYLCLAQRLGLPLEIITPPGHIYVRHNENGKITNIETTHRGVNTPSEAYYSVNVKHLKQISLKQTVTCVYSNLGVSNLMDEKYQDAIHCFEKALKYTPNDPLCTLMLGYSHAFNKNPKMAKKIFLKAKKLPFEDQISPIDFGAHLDYLQGHVDLETLKAAILPSRESGLEFLKEKEALLERGLKRHPNFISGMMMLSNIYCELSKPKKAIEVLNRVHDIDPDIPAAEFNLTLLYDDELNYPKCWQHFKQCEHILAKNKIKPKIMDDLKRMLLASSIEPL